MGEGEEVGGEVVGGGGFRVWFWVVIDVAVAVAVDGGWWEIGLVMGGEGGGDGDLDLGEVRIEGVGRLGDVDCFAYLPIVLDGRIG